MLQEQMHDEAQSSWGKFRRQDYMSLTGVFPKQQDCWHLGASPSDPRLGRVVHGVKLWRHERHKSEGSRTFPLWFQKAAETARWKAGLEILQGDAKEPLCEAAEVKPELQ